MKPNFTYSSKIFTFLLFSLLSFQTIIGQTFCTQDPIPSNQLDLRDNSSYKTGECPANDIQILGASLVRTGDPCNSCDSGTDLTADLFITINHGTNSGDRYLGVFADFTQTPLNGQPTTCKISRSKGPVLKGSEQINGQQVLNFGQITFKCGSNLKLSNILLVWTAANGASPVTTDNNPNGKYCFANPIIDVLPPFNAVVQANCGFRNTLNTDVIVTGGSGNFSYLWDTGETTKNLVNASLGTHTVTVTDNERVDGNGNPCKVTGSVTFNGPCCEFTTPTCKLTDAPQIIEGCNASVLPLPYTNPIDVFENIATKPCGELVMNYNDTSSGTICPAGLTIVRTYSLFDDLNDNQVLDEGEKFAQCTQNFKIVDTTPPTITGTLTAIATEGCTISDLQAPTNTLDYLRANGLTIDDACGDGGLTVTSSDSASSGTCPITLTRTYTVTDACSNATSKTQIITIGDTTAPVITGTLTVIATEGCTISDLQAPTNTLAYLRANGLTINDACGDSGLTVTSSDSASSGTCPITLTRTYTVTDACSNATSKTQIITIGDTTAPVITGTLTAVATEGCSISDLQAPTNTLAYLRANGLTINDACGDSGLTVTSSDSASSGTCPITLTRTYTVTDACSNATSKTQIITIDDTTAPVITGTLTAVATEGCSISDLQAPTNTLAYLRANGLTINDACGDSGLTVTFSDSASSGTCPITLTRTYTVTDACSNATSKTQIITIDDTTAPVITGTLTAVATEGCTISDLQAPTNTLAYLRANGLTINDACGDSGLTVTSSDSASSGTCPITLTRTYTVTDTCSNATSKTQIITIGDTTAPVITGTLTAVATEGCTISDLQAPTNTLAYLRANGLTINDACGDSGLTVTSSDSASSGTCPITLTRTYTVTDACSNATSKTQIITIDDTTAPIITGTLTAVATEGCTISDLQAPTNTLAYLRANGLTINDACGDSGLTVTSSDSASSGTCPITLTRTYTVTDACSNATSKTQIITIGDTTAPVITGTLTAVATEGCSISDLQAPTNTLAYLRANGLTINDACGDSGLTVTSSDSASSGTCPITLTRTYIVTDTCSNATSKTQIITIDDTTAPIITGTLTAVATEGCTISDLQAPTNTLAYLRANGLTINDACGDSGLTVTSSDSASSGTCPITLTRTYTVTDACSNATSKTQIITIDDTTAPIITGTLTAVATEGCTISDLQAPTNTLAYLRANGLTINDACGDSGLTVTSSDSASSGTCPITLTRTYTVTDACSNATSKTQIITIGDTTAPVITGTLTAVATEGCSISDLQAPTNTLAYLRANGLTINDACGDSGLTVTSSDSASSGTCPITLTRTYTVTDACSNATSKTQIITIDDTKAPTFTVPANITINTDQNCFADTSTNGPAGSVTIKNDNCDPNPTINYTDGDCFGNSNSQSINAGNGNYMPFTISGFDNLTANNIDKIALVFETNQGKGRAEFTLISPSGQGIILVGPYCQGGNCDDLTPNIKELYSPVFYPKNSNYPQWINSSAIPVGVSGNFTPYGAITSTNTIIGLTSYVSSFEELTGSMNGVWRIFSRKQSAVNGDINFKSICLTPSVNSCEANKFIVRKWTATDACGNKTQKEQLIKIMDTTAPTWTTQAVALNRTVECNDAEGLAAAQALAPVATDNCTTSLTPIKNVGLFVPGTICSKSGTYTNSWNISDDCGNAVAGVFTQTITIIDNTPPVIQTCASDKTIASNENCEAVVPDFTQEIIATDNCSPKESLTVTQSPVAGTIVGPGITTITVTIKDPCGKESTCNANLIVTSHIIANDDIGTTVNGYLGGISFRNVLANDSLNCVPIVAADVETTFVSSTDPGITLSGTNVVVAAGTPAGDYSLVYKICEVLNPSICDEATVTVSVNAATIIATDDTASPVNGYTGGTALTNVLDNDTLNGIAVLSSEVITTFVSSTNDGISLSGTDVLVAAGTPAGTYYLVYQICEILNDSNCDPATVTVTVNTAEIIANDDTGSPVNGYTGGTAFTNVLVNDTLNGIPVIASEVNTTFVSSTNDGITLAGTDILVAAGTPAGTYTLVYQICEILNDSNCDQATVTVTVNAAEIIANDDTGSPVNGYTGGAAFTNVLVNDTLNGVPVIDSEVNTTFVLSTNDGITLAGTDILVAAGTPAGTYTLVYQICEILNNSNCDQATVTVTVNAAEIIANDDTSSPVNGYTGGTAFTNVLVNDTLNGVPVIDSEVNTTFVLSTNDGITLAGTDILVAAGTPAGTYTLVYQICEILNNSNCDQATVTVTVNAAEIIANDDTSSPVNGYTGGTAFTNVLVNDTLNGVPVIDSEVNTTFVSSTNDGITLAGTDILVAAGTPAGTYTLVYQICEILNDSNCDQAAVTVTVNAAEIVANDDTGSPVNGYTGGTAFTNVLVNDTLNGVPVIASEVNTTFVSSTNDGITLAGNNVMVAAGTPAGTYTLVYQICEILNDSNCDEGTVTITVYIPSISITKDGTYIDSNEDGITNVGDTVIYNFVVTNEGTSPLTNVYITDPLPGIIISGGPITLAVGAIDNDTFTGTYAITQADIDNGYVYNLATVYGTPAAGPEVNQTSTDPTPCTACSVNPNCPENTDCSNYTITPLKQTPNIVIVKTNNIVVGENGCTDLKVGDVVTYTFTVTNPGNVSLDNVTVLDPHVGLSPIALQSGDDSNPGILDVDETWIYKATYTVTQTDIDNGKITNQASVSATAPNDSQVGPVLSGSSVTDTNPNVIPICTTASIVIVKTNNIVVGENGCADLKVGDVITYTFTVTNPGNVSLDNVTVLDPHVGLSTITLQSGDDSNPGILDVDETWIYKATYTVTQTDIDNGKISNQASVSATAPNDSQVGPVLSGSSATDTNPNVIPICTTASIVIVKTNNIVVGDNGCANLKVGDVITYTFTVTNPGNVSLDNVTVLDPHVGLSAITLQSGDDSNPGILDVDETWIYKATYTVTQTDIDNGKITNQASVSATAPDDSQVGPVLSGSSGTDTNPNVIPICTTANIVIVKTNDIVVGENGCANLVVGDVVTYTFTVTNPGNVSLDNVTVLDPHVGLSAITLQSGDDSNPGTMDVGETWIYKATYTVTQTDIDNGKITNQASVSATSPDDSQLGPILSGSSATDTNPNVIPICTTASIVIVKTNDIVVGENGCANLIVGDVVTYTFTVTNPGNVSLDNVTVLDPHVGLSAITLQSGDDSNPGMLDVDETWIYKATYTVTQADIDNGKITNQASVSATSPDDSQLGPVLSGSSATDTNPNVIPICYLAKIALVKTAVVGGTGAVGDIITYTFAVTNLGNVIISNINITDITNPSIALTFVNNPIATLAPSETKSITGTYTITQADIDLGRVTNSALAEGQDPKENDVKDISGTTMENDTPTVTTLTQNPSLTVIKTTNSENYSSAGDIINYTITVQNTGNVTLFRIAVKDPLTGLDTVIASLAPGISQEYAQTYTVTQNDIINRSVINVATANGFTLNDTLITASAEVVVEAAIVLPCGSITVHNAFSPNGDGINELFIIDNIDDTTCYPDNTVEIYNRWGVLVYETRGYNNSTNVFDGTSQGRATIGKSSGLPTGVYFYILSYTSTGNNGEIQTNKKDGYLYLTR